MNIDSNIIECTERENELSIFLSPDYKYNEQIQIILDYLNRKYEEFEIKSMSLNDSSIEEVIL